MGYRSRLEGDVAVALSQQGYLHDYESHSFSYVVEKTYTPDFRIDCSNPFFIEVKGEFKPEDRSKILEVKRSHPDLRFFVALKSPKQRLNKKSRTTYSEWCVKYGVPWCPIPIPPDFLTKWANGLNSTYPALPAPVQMRLL